MKKIIPFLIVSCFLLMLACGGGNGDSTRLSKLAASTSLRIGRSQNSSSPVATSAALNNGETVIVIFDPQTGLISEVLFKSQEGDVIRIVVDPSGRPIFAETNDTRISFSNFTDNASDVLIEQGGVALGSLNIPLQSETIGLLEGNQILGNLLGIARPDNDRQRGFLNSAVVAIRTVGCAGRTASSQISTSSAFSRLSSSACSSQILDEIVNVTTDETEDLSEITVTNIPDTGSCNNTGSLASAQSCTGDFGGKIEEASQKGVVGTFPKPKPLKPSKPKPPLHSIFEGHWAGPLSVDQQTTFCQDGVITFDILTNSDPSCANPNCSLVGMVVDNFNNHVALNGSLNQNDDIAFVGTSTIIGIPTSGSSTGHLDSTSLTGSGSFQNDQGCTGTYTVAKQP